MSLKSVLPIIVASFCLISCVEDDSGQDTTKDVESLGVFYRLLSFEQSCQAAYRQSFFGGTSGIGRTPSSRLDVNSRLNAYRDCSEIFYEDCENYYSNGSCGLGTCGRSDSDSNREQIHSACESFRNACNNGC